MPRKPRFNLIGMPQHVIQRGNNREPCFHAEEDYRRYLDDLHTSAENFQCRIHAYVLMTNHITCPPVGNTHGRFGCFANDAGTGEALCVLC